MTMLVNMIYQLKNHWEMHDTNIPIYCALTKEQKLILFIKHLFPLV